ncbi:DUF4180 domain-containing protein [Streptomyces sp. NPDC089919]|uniref:DUF4180 domain-containing protein n=1 Tax=Streptomyces sp. NPDC089919 TaxID=3155188 RepID=UPI0034320C8A
MSEFQQIHDVSVMMCPAEGEAIAGEQDALDLVGNAAWQGARWVVVPVGRFAEDFFRLRTKVAGDIIQKFVNYRVGLVVLGDISRHTEASSALQDFVRECNRGTQTWFLPDLEALRTRLGTA